MEYNDFSRVIKEKLGIELTREQYDKLEKYYEFLIDWNKKMNLTSITERDDVFIKHFLDSLSLVRVCAISNQTFLDVGSGAGFPSIPLKIIYEDLKVTIVDSLKKRINFLSNLVEALRLDSVKLIHGRIEEHTPKNSYDIVTARAVAKLNVLSELCVPYVNADGVFIAYKGSNYEAEIEESQTALKKLNSDVSKVSTFSIGGETRALVLIMKKGDTPVKYPRSFKKIKNTPL